MSNESSLTPAQKQWVEDEIKTRTMIKPIPGDEDSEMLFEANKEVIRALNKLDKQNAGETKDDFDTLVNVIFRSMMKSLLKTSQEKWRTEKLMEVNTLIESIESKSNISIRDKFTVKINKHFVKLLQEIKPGSPKLGKTKADFDKYLKACYIKAADTDIG